MIRVHLRHLAAHPIAHGLVAWAVVCAVAVTHAWGLCPTHPH